MKKLPYEWQDRPRTALFLWAEAEADGEEEHSSVTLGPWGAQDGAWCPEAVHCGPVDSRSAWNRGLSSASRTSLLRFHQPSMQSKLFPDTSSLCCYLSINVFQLALMEILNKVWKLKECEKPFLLLLELDIKKVWSIPCWAFVFKPWHVHARNSGERGYVLCILSRLVGCLVYWHGGKTLRAWQPFLRKQDADRGYRPLYRCWFSPPKKVDKHIPDIPKCL